MRRTLVVVAVIAPALPAASACHDAASARDGAVVGLDAPVPQRPSHGAIIERGPVALTWNAVGARTDVHYQVEADPGCASEPLACDPARWALESALVEPEWRGALPAGRWTWRVRACDAEACSPWSRPRRFDVGRVPSDVDGDGYSDVIAGAPLYRSGAGAALIVFGGPDGPTRTQRLDAPGGGDASDGELGSAVAIVGDVDADSYDDVVVGAPGTDQERGRAYLYLGGPDGVHGPVLVITDPHGHPGDWLGAAVSAAGDVDGDGHADVAVAAPGADGDGPEEIDRGKVLVWRGTPNGLASAPTLLLAAAPRPHDGFGSALSSGDLDGDGYGDVVVGAAGIDRAGAAIGIDRGAVYVFPGGDDGISSSPIARLEAPQPADHDRFGYSVSATGDLDGDGFADLAVGTPSRDDAGTDAGAVYIFSGGRTGVRNAPREVVGGAASPYRRLGTAVAIAGDVDGDGFDDLAVGTSDPGGGVAVVLDGAHLAGAPLGTLRLDATDPTDFGDSIAGAGDVDRDGHADVVVGAAIARGARGTGGSVLVYRAITAVTPPPPARVDGPADAAQLGRTVAGR